MRFEIREVDNGFVVKGETHWHGSFEFYCNTLSAALRRITGMFKTDKKKKSQ